MSQRESELVERRVAAVGCVFKTSVRLPGGRMAEVQHNANRGDLIRLTGAEAARLDAQGALAPEGWTAAQVDDAVEKRIADYSAGRRELEPEESGAF